MVFILKNSINHFIQIDKDVKEITEFGNKSKSFCTRHLLVCDWISKDCQHRLCDRCVDEDDMKCCLCQKKTNCPIFISESKNKEDEIVL